MGIAMRELLIIAVVLGICWFVYWIARSGNRAARQSKVSDTAHANDLNPGLYRLHRVFYLAIWIFGCLFSLLAWDGDSIGEKLLGFVGVLAVFGLLGLAHWYAAKGARLGKSYGRTISRVIASFWLIGVPVGTALGIWVFVRTSKGNWKSADEPQDRWFKPKHESIFAAEPVAFEGEAQRRQTADGPSQPDSRGPLTKTCPYCAETIKSAAVICRYCNRNV